MTLTELLAWAGGCVLLTLVVVVVFDCCIDHHTIRRQQKEINLLKQRLQELLDHELPYNPWRKDTNSKE